MTADVGDTDVDMASDRTLRRLTELYVQAQLRGDRQAALRLAVDEPIAAGYTVADVELGLVQPAQYEIGRLWQANEISVAQEHLATAISQLVLANLYRHLPLQEKRGKRALVACPAGELHDMGARVAADFLEMDGFDVTFLGADVPVDDLLRMIESAEPDVVVLSASTSLSFPGIEETLTRVAEVAPTVPILVGGGAFDPRTLPEGLVPEHVLHAGRDARGLVLAAREAAGV